jgi:peptidoglycan/xylan/chitin deacetylase (PgdA/CDA1 family)
MLSFSYKLPVFARLLPRTPSVLVYHGVPRATRRGGVDATTFEQHIVFLRRRFTFVHPQDVYRRRVSGRPADVLLTFDDGFRNNAEVAAPILRRHGVPAVFFICSRPSTPGKYLSCAYLSALRQHFKGNGFTFRREFMDMSPGQREATMRRLAAYLAQLKPHPAALYRAIEEELPKLEDFVSAEARRDECEGMSPDQVQELAANPLFTVGVHTVDHPRLTLCEPQEVLRQISENKSWLEQITGKPCGTIAYPYGDYNAETVESCRAAGLYRGYAVLQKLHCDRDWEVPRLGIYSPSLDVLGFKVIWGRALAVDRWPRKLKSVFPIKNTQLSVERCQNRILHG